MKRKERDWDKFIEWLIEEWIAPLGILALVIWAIVQIARMT